MTPDATVLREALDRASDAGRTIRVWLRDDDCVAPTPALDRLAGLCDGSGLPVLLAVIPDPTEAALADWVAAHPGFTPCQHGIVHANHAAPGLRAIELGGLRPLADILDDLARGRAKLRALFGLRLSDVLVPPWNRIDPALLPHLPGLGFSGLSTIAPSGARRDSPGLDCDLDIMDWRGGRVGRPLVELTAAAAQVIGRQDSLGLLTHHLVHDAGAWDGLGALVEIFAAHPAVRFASVDALTGTSPGG